MLYRTVFVCLFGLILVKYTNGEPVKINFKLYSTTTHVLCDHTLEDISKHTYTVWEAEKATINVFYKTFINRVSCKQHEKSNIFFERKSGFRNVTTFEVERRMGTDWDCEIWILENITSIQPSIKHPPESTRTYVAPHCYMRIHVRRKEAPQWILVNNVKWQPVRQDLSVEDVDFKLVYEYAYNDVVDITIMNSECNYLEKTRMIVTDTNINQFSHLSHSINQSLTSTSVLGVRIRLQSNHNNSHITCKFTDDDDFTNLQVVFIMRNRFDSSLSISVNGLYLRPKLQLGNFPNFFVSNYYFVSGETIVLLCEIKRDDLVLYATPKDDFKCKTEKNQNQAKAELNLIKGKDNMSCSADHKNNSTMAERTEINFIQFNETMARDCKIDKCPLYVELPEKSTVMELYELRKLRIIYYEFEDGDDVTITCYTTCEKEAVEVKMKINGTFVNETKPNNDEKKITKTLSLSQSQSELEHSCALFKKPGNIRNKVQTIPSILRESKVIFLKKNNLITTTTEMPTTKNTVSIKEPDQNILTTEENQQNRMKYLIWIVAGIVTGVIVVCTSTIIYKMNKRHVPMSQPQRGHEFPNQQFPAHMDNNYADPMDYRQDTETYSEPYRPVDVVYTTPIPKKEREKKNKLNEPTYAQLDIPANHCQKNTFIPTDDPNYAELQTKEANYAKVLPKNQRMGFKITDDPNYAEISKNIQANYAKVLPKSERNKPGNPYEHVKNDTYANVGQGSTEPTYCEPNLVTGLKNQYSNVANNSHYVNKTSDVDYVEPTYCETNAKRK